MAKIRIEPRGGVQRGKQGTHSLELAAQKINFPSRGKEKNRVGLEKLNV